MKFSAQMQEQGMDCPVVINNKRELTYLTKQIMRISILIIAFITISLQLLLANNLLGQDMSVEKVTVGLKGESLSSAIRQIEKQTTLRFFYRKADINGLSSINLPLASRTIEKTLYELLQSSNFSFRQVDQNILIQANTHAAIGVKKTVKGSVFTSDVKEPVKFAMVELLRKADLQLVGQGYTDTTGKFEVTTTDNSDHLIRISLLGYHVYSAQIANNDNLFLPAIYLTPDPKELREVVIAARMPLVKQEVDRLSYNVQADPDSKVSSLLDMMRKVPLLSVDAEDNVKLKGSSKFKVLIDGHASSLIVNDPKEIFRSMSATNVQRIEVITIPPAKYDAEGLAGIINIITVKRTLNGYSGNVNSNYKFPNGPRNFASFNYKDGKLAVAVYGGFNVNNTPHTNFSNVRQGILPTPSTLTQDGSAETKANNGFVSSQISYELDSLNLISASLNYGGNGAHKLGTVLTQNNNGQYSRYRLDNDAHGEQHNYGLGLDYQHGFRKNKGQLLSFSYRYSKNDNQQQNALTASEQLNYNIGNYNQENKSGLNEHTLQLDYTHPVKKLEIEAGGKSILRDNFSTYTLNNANPVTGSFVLAGGDHFTYQQNIYSVYNSYQLRLSKWTAKAGLRLERTTVSADFAAGGAVTIPDYNNLIPSVAIQRKLNKFTSINFGYTTRIQRPGISQLNPYVDQQNPDFINYGNPGLKPEVNHVLALNYGLFKNMFVNAGIDYSFSNNTIQYVSTLGNNGVTTGTYQNLGKNNALSANINLNFPITQHLSFNTNAEIHRVNMEGLINAITYKRSVFTGSANANLSYKFDKGWNSNLNFQYYSPAVSLQATSSPYYYGSISLNKAVNKKLTIGGSLSNPYLKYLDFKNTTIDPRFTQITHNDIVYRRFNLTINYAFGKLKDGAVKKNKKTVQNDDIKVIPSVIPNN